jgi:hypothetical protein
MLSATASPGPTVADSSDWCPFDHESQVPMGYLQEMNGKFKVEPTPKVKGALKAPFTFGCDSL